MRRRHLGNPRLVLPIWIASWFVFSSVAWVGEAVAGELVVTSVSPARHSLAASPDAVLTIDFDRAVDPASIGPASFWAFGRWSGTVSGTYGFASGNTRVTLTPDRPFSAGESVMVFLSQDIEAADGAFLRSAGYSFQFWVRALASFELVELERLSTDSPSRPYGGIASDLNEDGYLDITTVNEDTDDLRVFLNAGDGSGDFQPFLQPTEATGNVPSPSEPTDFNRDGHVDVVTGNTQAASISILLGRGDGTFDPQQEIAVGSAVRGVAVLDVDGDGDVDVAAASPSAGEVTVLLNNGAGVFGSPSTFGAGVSEWALAAGDMNDDGILDLVVGGQSSQRIYVYTGQGDGTFTLTDDQPSGGDVWMIVLGDVDGNGTEDVSAANSSANNGAILLGDGAGGLGAAQTHATDSFPLATDLGDLDGDGDLDWIVASFGGDWTLFTNDGDGTFTFDREFAAPAAASCSLMMDIDNDGDLDLALIDELADELIVLENVDNIFTDGFESGNTTAWGGAR
ncbi:MAG: FG-GAP-like repeat-containing protein [Acidobacteriota bacterium]